MKLRYPFLQSTSTVRKAAASRLSPRCEGRNVNGKILGLLKFGATKDMDDFRLNGTMYMNILQYFRALEEKGDIGDEDEGLDSCYQSDRVNVKITTQYRLLVISTHSLFLGSLPNIVLQARLELDKSQKMPYVGGIASTEIN